MNTPEIKIATLEDLDKIIPTMMELRPHRSVDELRNMMIGQLNDGFQLIYVGDEQLAYAVAGFRTLDFLFSGKTLYV
ncbi:MAG TPA: hypothetical protein VGK46_09040, partial [Saprospiraceae bacterium]